MKKILFLLICFLCVCTSCSNKEEESNDIPEDIYENKSGESTCILEYDKVSLKLKGTYVITYENGYVVKTYTREVVTLGDSDSADSYEKTLKAEYDKYKDIEYYNYDINRMDNKITSSSLIDYKNIDLEELNSVSAKAITRDELKYSNILGSYKIMGATCSEN